MRGIFILSILFVLVACVQSITTTEDMYDRIVELDEIHKTDYRQEMFNKVILNEEALTAYLSDLAEIEKQIMSDNNKTKKQMNWLIQARKQMLLSQIDFQKAWFGVGATGRVTDGFKCSDLGDIKRATLLFESAFGLAYNSTQVLDALMTENENMKEKIGVGNDKPAIYDSDFNGLFEEIESNVGAMRIYCNQTVPTNTFNFGERNETT